MTGVQTCALLIWKQTVCPLRSSARQAAWAMAWLKLRGSGWARMTEISIGKRQHSRAGSRVAEKALNPARMPERRPAEAEARLILLALCGGLNPPPSSGSGVAIGANHLLGEAINPDNANHRCVM